MQIKFPDWKAVATAAAAALKGLTRIEDGAGIVVEGDHKGENGKGAGENLNGRRRSVAQLVGDEEDGKGEQPSAHHLIGNGRADGDVRRGEGDEDARRRHRVGDVLVQVNVVRFHALEVEAVGDGARHKGAQVLRHHVDGKLVPGRLANDAEGKGDGRVDVST